MCDFGFATSTSPNTPLEGFFGTNSYVAPEILDNLPYDGEKVDIFSLGVVFYNLVIGKTPFTEAS